MNYLTLGGGAIACSAIAVYGWAQAPREIKVCPGQWVEKVSSSLTGRGMQQVQENCLSNHWIPTINTAPERMQANVQIERSQSTKLPNSVEQIYRQLLEQSHKAANSDRLAEAIASAASIPKNSQHYDMAQRLQEDWSQELLQRASSCYQQANLPMAMSMLSAIPDMSQRHARASELHDRWSQQAIVLSQALAAKETGNWREVMNQLEALEGTQLYQSAQVQALLQQATSKAFAPDTNLLQLAAAQSSTAYAAALPSRTNDLATLSVPPPQPANLSIGIEQALEWARPTAESQISLPPKTPKWQNSSNPLADSSPIKSSIPVSQ